MLLLVIFKEIYIGRYYLSGKGTWKIAGWTCVIGANTKVSVLLHAVVTE